MDGNVAGLPLWVGLRHLIRPRVQIREFTSAPRWTALSSSFLHSRLNGDPMISTAGGATNLVLVAVNGITSGGAGGSSFCWNSTELLLATQDGSIDLGS